MEECLKHDATASTSAKSSEKKSLRKLQIAHLREAARAYTPFVGVTGSEGKESD
jgi:hypothetical protein